MLRNVFAFGIAAAVAAAPASAVDNLKMLIPANPGGGWDQTGRALAQAMQSAGIAKSIRIENRGGAGGTIGLAQYVSSSRGDGASLMISGLVMVGAIGLNKSPVTLEQVTPIARLSAEYDAIVVPANSKFQNLRELLAAFKANPGSVAWGGGSAGGVDHILVGLVAKAVGADVAKINYVPFAGGGEANAAILGGHVAAGVSGYGEMAAHMQSGKMRGFAISSSSRVPGVTLPTLKEQGVDVEVYNWRGVFAPPGITEAQRDELTRAVVATAKSPAWQETLKRNDWSDVLMTGEEFRRFVDAEQRRVNQVLADIGLLRK